MKKLTLKETSIAADALIRKIKRLCVPGERVRLMEVCGTHTVAIFREGIRSLLPEEIELVSGPGCPVCVTDGSYIDKALAYAAMEDVILVTFGDMLKVPGKDGNLGQARAAGADIRIMYGPLDVIDIGRANPDKIVILLAIGFETTVATMAGTMAAVIASELGNVRFLISHKLVPPALEVLLTDGKSRLDGFLLPGHVSVIIGEKPYAFLADRYRMPSVIAGFTGVELLTAVADIMEQRDTGRIVVGNTYRSAVKPEGNPVALRMMDRYYEVCDDTWRGLGLIPQSGLKVREEFARIDIERERPVTGAVPGIVPHGCSCGDVLQGIVMPKECNLFGRVCTPDHAVGPCMVSDEGACAAWYRFGAGKTELWV